MKTSALVSKCLLKWHLLFLFAPQYVIYKKHICIWKITFVVNLALKAKLNWNLTRGLLVLELRSVQWNKWYCVCHQCCTAAISALGKLCQGLYGVLNSYRAFEGLHKCDGSCKSLCITAVAVMEKRKVRVCEPWCAFCAVCSMVENSTEVTLQNTSSHKLSLCWSEQTSVHSARAPCDPTTKWFRYVCVCTCM